MKGTNIKSLSISTISTITATVLITIVGEFSEPFKNFLKLITGHHWVTKSVFMFILFFAIYFLLYRTDDNLDVWKESLIVGIVALIGVVVLIGFFFINYLLA